MLCEKIFLYEGREDVSLTTYVLEDSPEMLNGKRRPAVLICPGGAYLSCSDREGEPIAMAFAAMGYHAFVLRYSVYNEGKPGMMMDPTQKLEPKPHCVFPNPMRDIGKALLYIRGKAAEWLVDEARIAICGFSAGAHNCAMYSVYWNKPEVAGFFGDDAQKLRPAAAILAYTLSDYIFMKENATDDPVAKGLFAASGTALLGTPEADDALLEKASPARRVDGDTPPMFLWATSADSMVPVQHSTLLATALANQGTPFELHVFEEGAHGLATATQASAAAHSQIDENAAKWVGLCGAWLQKRFALDLPEKTFWEMAGPPV